jgi:hypothetical protein
MRRKVRAYYSDLAYGGPEEGGWWYRVWIEWAELPGNNVRIAKKSIAKLKERFKNEIHGEWEKRRWDHWNGQCCEYEVSSVLGKGEVIITCHDGESWHTKRRPHYE